MFVKLSNELIKELSIEEQIVSWTELKAKLKALSSGDSDALCLLKGSKLLAKLPEVPKERTLTSEEYYQLIFSSAKPNDKEDIHTEIVQLRSDLAELRRESAWLFNCFLSVIGTVIFVYFVVSFYFDKLESRIVFSLISGLVLFFIEVLLYIIRY